MEVALIHDLFMGEALKQAKIAFKKNEIPVGAIIVKDGKIISRAYNLKESKKNSLYHAEIIAINKACKKLKNNRLKDCELYVTLEPCLMCAGAIVMARIKKIYIGASDDKYGAIYSKTRILDADSNHKVEYEKDILKEDCSEIIKDFFNTLRKNKQ